MDPMAPTLEERTAARLLGIHIDTDVVGIRAAFRKLTKAVHPDRSSGGAPADIGRLAEARDHLLERAERRARYRAQVEADNERRRSLAKARSKTLFDDHLIDLTNPLGHLVDVTG